jgi:hypothetical protein
MPVTAYWKDVGVGETAMVRDLWARKDLGAFPGTFTAEVPKFGVVLVKVK